MAKEFLPIPTDTVVEGMPLPIIIPFAPPGNREGWNRHHTFYESDFYLNGTEESIRAVRFSRLQWAPIKEHNKYHALYKVGVTHPENELQAFQLSILGCAGYIPEEGIDVMAEDPEDRRVLLSHQQLRALRQPGIFVVEGEDGGYRDKRNVIGKFLVDYLVQNGIKPNIDDNKKRISRFMGAKNSDKLEKGLRLIELATEAAGETTELDVIYRGAKKRRALRQGAGACPERQVRNHIQSYVPGFEITLHREIALILD